MTDDSITAKTERLEEIIDQLEAGEVSLARAKELHEEGESLLEDLRDELDVADGEVIDQ
jgi:Exonuclease VII small subunit.